MNKSYDRSKSIFYMGLLLIAMLVGVITSIIILVVVLWPIIKDRPLNDNLVIDVFAKGFETTLPAFWATLATTIIYYLLSFASGILILTSNYSNYPTLSSTKTVCGVLCIVGFAAISSTAFGVIAMKKCKNNQTANSGHEAATNPAII